MESPCQERRWAGPRRYEGAGPQVTRGLTPPAASPIEAWSPIEAKSRTPIVGIRICVRIGVGIRVAVAISGPLWTTLRVVGTVVVASTDPPKSLRRVFE